MIIYDANGKAINTDSGSATTPNIDYNKTVLSVNHRGYSVVAPENTLPAYILSKKMGFDYVETDVSFTSDGIPVLLHDSTIDRTSNGSGNINELTFNQVRQFDFGSWKSSVYTGTKIPSLEEFLYLCKSIILHPYIELKSGANYTEAQIQQIVDMVKTYGLKGKVTYISFYIDYLTYVKNYDDEARLGYLGAGEDISLHITRCKNLRTDKNEVFYDCGHWVLTDSLIDAFKAEDIPIEMWTVDDASIILARSPYVSGITSDNLIAGKVLYDNAING